MVAARAALGLYGGVMAGWWSSNTPWKLMLVAGIGRSLLTATCWALLLAAVLASRRPDEENRSMVP